MLIVNLASGSKGNSTFIEYNQTKLLIDVGLSEKQIKERLSEIGKDLSDIVGICITHEHIDHIRSLKTIAKNYNCDFFVHQTLIDDGILNEDDFKPNKLHTFKTDKFFIGDIEVQPFDLSHDAVAPVGFVFKVVNSKSKFGIITDTGYVPENALKLLEGSKIVFLESNYDKTMLENGFYPEKTKQRIFGKMGHLSNDDSLEVAKKLFLRGTKCFVLSHISENNNTYDLAKSNFLDYFISQGLELDKDVFIRLSYQGKHGNNFYLSEEF